MIIINESRSEPLTKFKRSRTGHTQTTGRWDSAMDRGESNSRSDKGIQGHDINRSCRPRQQYASSPIQKAKKRSHAVAQQSPSIRHLQIYLKERVALARLRDVEELGI